MQTLLQLFIEYSQIVIDYFNHFWGYIELAGSIATLICVYLAVKQNIWTWFWGAIGVALFGPLLYHYQLYSDAGLQILFYLPIQFLGFWYWMKKGPTANNDLPVSRLEISTIIGIILSIGVLTWVNGILMATYTDASFPFWDAFTTWMSVFAQILMIRKYVESWALWVTVDIISVPIYFIKGIVVWSGIYAIFLVLATMGGIAWYKSWKQSQLVTNREVNE